MMKKLKGHTSAVQVSSSSPRCFKTWTQLNWTGAGLTKPNWIGKQKKWAGTKLDLKKLRQTCILATLSIPTNLGSSWSTLQPSLVNLSTLVRFDHLWWDLVRFGEIWWELVRCGEPLRTWEPSLVAREWQGGAGEVNAGPPGQSPVWSYMVNPLGIKTSKGLSWNKDCHELSAGV